MKRFSKMLKKGFATAICAVVVIRIGIAQSQTDKFDAMQNEQTEQTTRVQAETSRVIEQFNNAFSRRDPSLLVDIIAETCVMESIQGPDGIRYHGYEACLAFWEKLINDKTTRFEVEDVVIVDKRAIILWRYHWGDGFTHAVRGLNLMKVDEGKIEEALGYSKTVPSTGLDK